MTMRELKEVLGVALWVNYPNGRGIAPDRLCWRWFYRYEGD